jgi:hypothetical protein
VRRTWDTQDFPEWTTIKEFAPNVEHQVPYNTFSVDPFPVVLSRPLKVYLVDPRFTPYPIDTPFREWDQGLHVGFEHGATVWIKYLGPAPRFTSIPWDSSAVYDKGDLAYSPDTGECYKSLVNGNIGIDPAQAGLQRPVNLTTEVTVPFAPGSPATATVPEKWSVRVDVLNLYARANQIYSISFLDGTGAPHTLSYTTPAADGTVDNLLTGLIAAGAASGDSWITALALSKDLPHAALIITLATGSFTVSTATVTSPDEPVTGDDGLAVTGDDGLAVTAGP